MLKGSVLVKTDERQASVVFTPTRQFIVESACDGDCGCSNNECFMERDGHNAVLARQSGSGILVGEQPTAGQAGSIRWW